MSRWNGGWTRAAVSGVLTASLVLLSYAAYGAERSGRGGGGGGSQLGRGGGSGTLGGGESSGGLGSGGSGSGVRRLGDSTPAPALPPPESSLGKADDPEVQKRLREFQAAHGQVAGEQAFMRTLRAHFVPGTWKPDQIADPSDGSTLLHVAVKQGYPEAVQYLLKQGANPLSKDLLGTTPLALAKEIKQDDLARMLEDAVAARKPSSGEGAAIPPAPAPIPAPAPAPK